MLAYHYHGVYSGFGTASFDVPELDWCRALHVGSILLNNLFDLGVDLHTEQMFVLLGWRLPSVVSNYLIHTVLCDHVHLTDLDGQSGVSKALL